MSKVPGRVTPTPRQNKRDANNIEVTQLESLSWKTPQEIETSIQEVYQYAEARAADTIDWYLRAKKSKAQWSRWLRFAAIVLTALGGLTPIIISLGWLNGARAQNLGQLGYLFLGLAAACVGLDKFFGFSSGWMRYITTALALQKTLSEFRLDWAMLVAKLGGATPTNDQVQLMLQRLKDFVLVIDGYVEQETLVWIAEFQSSLADIERTARTQGEAARPGAIDITVTNGMDAEGGFTVSLDGMVTKTVRGTKYQIGYVPPGPHKVGVTGVINGQPLDASELVNVPPGVIAKVTLALPVEEAQP
ncbi:MAG TPA: SLATT domain-containing protein [Herpetosiphonaceae bacterium]